MLAPDVDSTVSPEMLTSTWVLTPATASLKLKRYDTFWLRVTSVMFCV
jgi:hypothetical protein